ncbi:MAG: adenylosuccinate synthetase [Lachnospiraceae bacterium]|nr:adenylosuccinate synthetase [Lachnospiraceae bacterium]
MKTAKIVIGANFGDEGKGLMTDYFANEAKKQGESCLVVCHNGGSQRGHTVVAPSGFRHVFHHFGSGSFEGADTYLASEFIVNPIIFQTELSELKRNGFVTKCFIDRDCRFTTPFDMMINQIVEEYRGDSKHGSCGLGIFETIVRSRTDKSDTIYEFSKLSASAMRDFLDTIATEYVPDRLKQLGIKNIPEQWIEILRNKDNIIENYIDDFWQMLGNVRIVNNDIVDDYDYVIFEGAQGLLLDQNNVSYMPHLTPSNTGVKNPLDIIGKRKAALEVCYVSRTYMTRHGAGRFDTECNKSDINEKIIDLTNIPNPYQDSIRYGMLMLDDLKNRIRTDLGNVNGTKSLAVTHLNEYKVNQDELKNVFGGFQIYISDGMTHDDVYRL